MKWSAKSCWLTYISLYFVACGLVPLDSEADIDFSIDFENGKWSPLSFAQSLPGC